MNFPFIKDSFGFYVSEPQCDMLVDYDDSIKIRKKASGADGKFHFQVEYSNSSLIMNS